MDAKQIHLQWFGDGDDEITIEQIRAFIDANKERADVIEMLSSYAPEKELSSETVNAYLETPEGKVILQPRLDRYATQAIKTHDEKQAPVIEAKIKAGINEGIRKLHPEETEEQKQVREMREDIERIKKESAEKELRNAILMEANNRHIPKELVDLPYPSVEHFINAATVIESTNKKLIEAALNEFAAKNSFKPGGGKDKEKQGMTFSEYSKLPRAERERMAETGEINKLIPD
ncbi:MAG: hypothetical protein PHE29_02105 [Tissierellia bacterium]|nr:hypothetical protein [Tissierellia bacterium]